MSDVIRVFPRKTNATPDDENVRFGPPGLFDTANEVRVSVSWTWDKPKAEELANQWRMVTKKVFIGGPAYDDPGGEFEPGMYLKKGHVITSRGCPNNCWFCSVHKREGGIRELKINDGYIVHDSNILACSDEHITRVFLMLKNQKERIRLNGGLDTRLLKPWHVDEISKLRLKTLFMAYDEPGDFEPLVCAGKLLKDAGIIKPEKHIACCYVLVGYKSDTMELAEIRLRNVAKLGIMPFAMLYNHGRDRKDDAGKWIHFTKTWANRIIVGAKMKEVMT